MVGVAALIAAAVLLVLTRDEPRIELPPPERTSRVAAASLEEFVGSEVCAGCHSEQYEAWSRSTHGRAGGDPAERAIAPFDGGPIRFRDATVFPLITSEGDYAFRVVESDGPERTFVVAGVVGGGHMVGGGTQGFFSEFADGTLRFLPFDFHAGDGVWFCQTGGRSDEGWRPITPEVALADCSDWPPRRVLGSHDRFSNCQGCHGSQIELRYDPNARRYRTRYTTLAVNCESCHGPGLRHVEIARSGGMADSLDIGMRPLATLEEDEALRVCFQCHAVKEELLPGHLTGRPVEEHFSLKLPLLSYRPYFPDGRIRLFAYQQTHLFSDCYLNGTLTCVACHDPHSQGYRDVWGNVLTGRFDDGQCTGCHAGKAGRLEDHTHHPKGSPGSRCVACHMPYLQEPDVGDRLRYARSDHTIPIPRPSLDTIFGIDSACQGCHAWPLDHVQRRIAEWYGELKPIDESIEGLIRARGLKDRRRAAELMIGSRGAHPVLLMQGLGYYFLTYLEPDMPALDPVVVARLRELAAADDPDLQGLALAALHLARGEDPAVRRFLAETLRSLAERGPAVRRRWAWVLRWRGSAYLQRRETRRALATFGRALEVTPGDAGVLSDMADAYARVGAYEDAIATYRVSLLADSLQPLTLANLGFALVQSGRADEGVQLYRRAVMMNPWQPEIIVSLGKVYVQQGSLEEAVDAFQRAIALDPGLAEAHFSLAVVYADRGEVEQAIRSLRRGLEFQRDAEGARALLSRLEALRR